MTKREMAVKIINLRKTLRAANEVLKEKGSFGLICDEDATPPFLGSRTFWAQAKRLSDG